MATPTRRSATVFPHRGKWRLTYIDASGKERSRTAESKQAAYELLIEVGAQSSATPQDAHKSLESLSSWFAEWLPKQAARVRRNTYRSYEGLGRLHIIPTLGAIPLANLSPLQIENLYLYLKNNSQLSQGSIQRVHALLSAVLKDAQRLGLIGENPMLRVQRPKGSANHHEILAREQVAQLLDVAAKHGPLVHLRWTLALKYGLRQSEALALSVDDFNLSTKVLRVDKQLQRIPHQGFTFTAPKSRTGIRDLPINDEVIELVRAIQATRQRNSALIFCSPTGQPRHASQDRAEWLNLLNEAELPTMPLHSARHTAATEMIQAGVNVRAVQLVLGHSTPSFTLATYVHPSVDQIRSELEKLN